MRKRTLLTFLIIALVLCFPLTVSAHSGGTDSKGGHTDHSTGQYHYHCGGNPAHQHFGGVCPYKTTQKPSTTGYLPTSKVTTAPVTPSTPSNYTSATTSNDSGPTVGTVVGMVLGPTIFCGIWWLIAKRKGSDYWAKWALATGIGIIIAMLFFTLIFSI